MSETLEKIDRVFLFDLARVATLLEEGYVFDPWLCAKGYPITMGENGWYWVLIKPEVLDDLDLVAKACPFKQLPAEPSVDQPAGHGTVYVPHQDNVDATAPWRKEGYVLLHKDHVTSKGTIMTLTKNPEEEVKTEEKENGKK